MNWSKVRHKSKSLRIGKQNIFYVEVHKCYFVTNTGDLLPAKRRSQEHCGQKDHTKYLMKNCVDNV